MRGLPRTRVPHIPQEALDQLVVLQAHRVCPHEGSNALGNLVLDRLAGGLERIDHVLEDLQHLRAKEGEERQVSSFGEGTS